MNRLQNTEYPFDYYYCSGIVTGMVTPVKNQELVYKLLGKVIGL